MKILKNGKAVLSVEDLEVVRGALWRAYLSIECEDSNWKGRFKALFDQIE